MPRLYRDFETQEQIDAQYDPALPVADRAAEIRHYAERSAHARATLACRTGVPYGPTRAETLSMSGTMACLSGMVTEAPRHPGSVRSTQRSGAQRADSSPVGVSSDLRVSWRPPRWIDR